MKIKSILSGFISILFVFLAKAEDDTNTVSPVHYTQAAYINYAETSVHNDAVFKCKVPESKARKIRQRFRNASLFEIQLNNAEQTSFSLHAALAPVSARNKTSVQPFYYTFLFRLTPF